MAAVHGATAIVSTKNRVNRLKESHSCVAAVFHTLITQKSHPHHINCRKRPMFAIMG
jgi:hypothetical protein